MKRSRHYLSIIIALSLAFLCNRPEASLFYNFEELGTGRVLATLELASLPATHAEVLGLTLTDSAQGWGFGPIYLGSFDSSYNQFVSDGVGGLESSAAPDFNAEIVDDDPPMSAAAPQETVSFALTAGSIGGPPDIDRIRIERFGGPRNFFDNFPGVWRVDVPEPSQLLLGCLVAPILVVLCGRRRRCDE